MLSPGTQNVFQLIGPGSIWSKLWWSFFWSLNNIIFITMKPFVYKINQRLCHFCSFLCVFLAWDTRDVAIKTYNHYLLHGQLITRARGDEDQDKSDKREGYNWLRNCTRVEGGTKNEEGAPESSTTAGGRPPNRGSFAGGILTPLLLPRSCSLGWVQCFPSCLLSLECWAVLYFHSSFFSYSLCFPWMSSASILRLGDS